MEQIDRTALKALIQEILQEKFSSHGVLHAALPQLSLTESDRLDTGNPSDRVYTHDLFSLEQSPRLGAGLMEMTKSTFPWTLQYDEIDYVISGTLTVKIGADTVVAHPGEVILIPKDSQIQFSAPDFARFLYVTYPADWQHQ